MRSQIRSEPNSRRNFRWESYAHASHASNRKRKVEHRERNLNINESERNKHNLIKDVLPFTGTTKEREFSFKNNKQCQKLHWVTIFSHKLFDKRKRNSLLPNWTKFSWSLNLTHNPSGPQCRREEHGASFPYLDIAYLFQLTHGLTTLWHPWNKGWGGRRIVILAGLLHKFTNTYQAWHCDGSDDSKQTQNKRHWRQLH